MALYSSSKVFISYLGEALGYEFRDTVDVISYRPASVDTNMNPNKKFGEEAGKKLKWDYITPERAAFCCFRDLGHEYMTYGDIVHELFSLLIRSFPKSIFHSFSFKEMCKTYDRKQK